MKTFGLFYRLVVVVTSCLHSTGSLAQQGASFCITVGTVSIEAARLRDGGVGAEAAVQRLAANHPQDLAQAAANAAYVYSELQGAPLSDVVNSFCIIMTRSGNKPNDAEKLWFSTQLERSTECSKKGAVEKDSYAQCLGEQEKRDSGGAEGLVLPLMRLEAVLQKKSVCEHRFPQYAKQNADALRASTFANVSSEALIQKYGPLGQRQNLLRGLISNRRSTRDGYLAMDGEKFQKMCAEFPQQQELIAR